MVVVGDAKAGHFCMTTRSTHGLDGKRPGVSRVVKGQFVGLGAKDDHIVIEPARGKDFVLGSCINLLLFKRDGKIGGGELEALHAGIWACKGRKRSGKEMVVKLVGCRLVGILVVVVRQRSISTNGSKSAFDLY